MGLIRSFLIFFSCFATLAFPAEDIDALLKQVDSALSGAVQKTNPAIPEQQPLIKEKKPPVKTPPQTKTVILEEPIPPTRFSEPLDQSSLSEILNADTTSRVTNLLSPSQGPVFRVSSMLYGLSSGYVLSKDDDSFHVQPSVLGGVNVSFQPSWSLDLLSTAALQSRFCFSLGGGLAYGNASVVRTGVMSGRENYSYFLIPIQSEVGILTQVGPYVGLQLGYGYGVDLLNQRGIGVSDTTNALFGTDQLSLTVRFLWDTQTEIFASWASRGIGLLPSQQNAVSGFAFKAGMGFHLGG